ncbi:HNH endonuclease [Muriicola jejuensis]|uniref:HNH endonuclease n=2 Tax=Muriicola jejuensis TaxID=504488 RepID=A0A6P0UFH1_9FLAO|nr:HNH endonuclease domain-containing protein [Muriicola jejuensis]NER11767.1 HNH endonuclease [Muriicola jejuensis]
MANNWGIPKDVENVVRLRDGACVYCGVDFSIAHASRKTKPTWEHIVNDIRINGVNNIALCCTSCNASKGAKLIEDWLRSSYCLSKGISFDSVAQVVKDAILNPPTLVG